MSRLHVTPEKAERIILYYCRLRWSLINGKFLKINARLKSEAERLGFSAATAWRFIEFGRRIGMVEGEKYLRGY